MPVAPLQSPAFWEVPELRCVYSPLFLDFASYLGLTAAVLAYLNEETSHLDIVDVVRTLEDITPSDNLSLDIPRIQTVYTILRYTPMEYIPRSVRIDLTRKAVVLDAWLTSVPESRLTNNNLLGALSLFREYMSRSIMHAAVFEKRVLCHPSHPPKSQLISFEEMDAVTKYLLDPRWNASSDSPAFPGAITEQLIGVHLGYVVCSRLEYTREPI